MTKPSPTSDSPAAPAAKPARTKAEILASLPQAVPFVSPALAAHRDQIAAHRSAAFIRYLPTVAGVRLRPVSLRTRERIFAFGVDLNRGRFEDLADFLWLHHPAFGQFSTVRRALFIVGLRWRLTPAWPRLGSFLLFAGKLLSAGARWRGFVFTPVCLVAWLVTFGRPASSEERLGAALAEARQLWHRAHFDWPAGDDSDAAPDPVCSAAASLLHAIKGRHPALSADEILDWPMIELVQWWRAIIIERNPKALLLDREEARLLAAELEPETKEAGRA